MKCACVRLVKCVCVVESACVCIDYFVYVAAAIKLQRESSHVFDEGIKDREALC